jgi:hypothetical protein
VFGDSRNQVFGEAQVMQGENAPNDILINTVAERQIDLVGNTWTTIQDAEIECRPGRRERLRINN